MAQPPSKSGMKAGGVPKSVHLAAPTFQSARCASPTGARLKPRTLASVALRGCASISPRVCVQATQCEDSPTSLREAGGAGHSTAVSAPEAGRGRRAARPPIFAFDLFTSWSRGALAASRAAVERRRSRSAVRARGRSAARARRGDNWTAAEAAARAIVGPAGDLKDFRPGLVPPLESSYRPAMLVTGPAEGVSATVAKAARQAVSREIEHGDRAAPSGAVVLELAPSSRAPSHDPEQLFRVDTQFTGRRAASWRGRLEEPVLASRFARAMAANWQRVHASQCRRCREVTPEFELAGFHRDCWGLMAEVATTRGWLVPIDEEPPSLRMENYPSVRQFPHSAEAAFVKIAKGAAFAAASEVKGAVPPGLSGEFLREPPSFINPSTGVVKHAEHIAARREGREPKMRYATDLKRSTVNGRFELGKFRYTAMERLMQLLSPGCWMYSVDISSFYTRLWVACQSRKWLAIEVPWLSEDMRTMLGAPSEAFVDDGLKRANLWIRFRSMPFGLKCACLWASQVTAMICQYAASKGVEVVSYIDDIAGAARSRAEANRRLAVVIEIVVSVFGLPIAELKTVEATQRMEWLGWLFDSLSQMTTISDRKNAAMVSEIGDLLDSPTASRSALKSCLGRLSWLAEVMLGARGRVAPVYRELRSVRGLRMSKRLALSDSARADLSYFEHKLRAGSWTGARWLRPHEEAVSVRSDASDSAMFAINAGRFFAKRFTPRERRGSSHSRELVPTAIVSGLIGHEWAERVVGFTFDNTGSAFSTSSLSSSDRGAQVSLRKLGDNASRFNFQPVGVWQPRSALVALDAGSKVVALLETGEPVYIPFAAAELAAATVSVGKGIWLFPVARDAATGTVIGYVAGDEGATY